MAEIKVEEVKFTAESQISRLILRLTGSPAYKLFTLTDPPRVIIDLSDARLAASLPDVRSSGSPIQAVRSGTRNGHDLRVVLDVDGEVATKSFLLQPSGKQGYRLVI